MNSKTDFFEKVYAVVKQIPFGRVSTYGAIARFSLYIYAGQLSWLSS